MFIPNFFPKMFFSIDGDPPAGGGAPPAAPPAGAPPAGAPPAGAPPAGAPPADPARAGYPAHVPPAGAPPAAVEFEKIIPEAYKDKPWVKETKDVETLFKRVDDLTSELGKRPSAIPQENAKPEEWQKFNKAFGVPEKPEGYEFSAPPEGLKADPDFQKSIQGILHEAGVSSRQFKKIEPAWNALMLQMAKNTGAAAQALDADFDKLAGSTFGDRKDRALQTSKAMIDKFTPDALKPHLANLGNKELVILAGVLDGIITKYVNEDELPPPGGGGGGPVGSEARRAEALKLMQSEEYRNAFHPKHKEVVAKVEELYKGVK